MTRKFNICSHKPAKVTAHIEVVVKVCIAGNILVWFPDPSVMRMRGRGKKGLGNNYTPARALEFDLHVAVVSGLHNSIMNIDKQASV